ncbi:MAG: hypothetical protein U0324_00535 [Polyangiales bacterium]
MRLLPRLLGAASTALVASANAPDALAFDAEVRADTQAQAYQVRGPAGAPLLSMRRVTQTLTVAGFDRARNGVVWSVRARLRFDSDFGNACDVTGDRCLDELNRSRAAEFAPLFARRTLDLPFAWAEGAGLLGGTTDVRLGRQLVTDPLGFFLFDGGRLRVRAFGRVVFEAYGGLETRAGFPLSNGRYERDGIQRADRSLWDTSLATRVEDRALAGVLSFGVETADTGPLFARATWRRVWGDDGVAEEKLGVAADVQLSTRWRAYAEAVHSIPQQQVTNAAVGAAWAGERGSFGAELSRWRPTFDLTSIWASFWTDPLDEGRLRGELALGRGWRLRAGAHGRRYALSESPPDDNGVVLDDQWSGGGELGVTLRRGRYDADARVFGEGGGLGARAGADVTSRVWVKWQVVRVDAGVSAWWVDDALRPDRSVASLGLVVGALVRAGRLADLALSFEDDVNRIVGHRLRAVAMLTLRTPW